jgi:4-oxalocrotonate tautomerase family enzyme
LGGAAIEEERVPIINVKVLEGAFSEPQKHAMIDEITNAMVKIGGDGIRPAVHVLVEEVSSGMWGIGGNRLTKEEIEDRRRQRAARGTT